MPLQLARAASQWPSCLPHGAKLATLSRLAAASTGGESESGAGRGSGAGFTSSAAFDTFLLLFRGASHKRRGAAVRVSGVCRPSDTAELCHQAAAAPNEQETEQKRSETGWRSGQSATLPAAACVHGCMSTSNQLRCPSLVANSAGPATSTSAEQPAASPPLLPSITNSFLSSFPPSFLSRILSLSVLPAYSPYARARPGNYGNGSNVDGHAQQQLFWLHERKTRAPSISALC